MAWCDTCGQLFHNRYQLGPHKVACRNLRSRGFLVDDDLEEFSNSSEAASAASAASDEDDCFENDALYQGPLYLLAQRAARGARVVLQVQHNLGFQPLRRLAFNYAEMQTLWELYIARVGNLCSPQFWAMYSKVQKQRGNHKKHIKHPQNNIKQPLLVTPQNNNNNQHNKTSIRSFPKHNKHVPQNTNPPFTTQIRLYKTQICLYKRKCAFHNTNPKLINMSRKTQIRLFTTQILLLQHKSAFTKHKSTFTKHKSTFFANANPYLQNTNPPLQNTNPSFQNANPSFTNTTEQGNN